MWVRVLGPLTAEVGSASVVLGGPKQRLVLALLAVRANRAVAVDELIDEVWAEDPPSRPRKTLQVYVANLRRLLQAPDRLVGGPAGYALRLSADELDLAQFDRLLAEARALRESPTDDALRTYAEALALWTPPALGDLRGFEATRRLLRPHEERRAEALDELMTLKLERGRHAELVGELLQLCADDPWRERWWWLLMQACYRGGRQADALDTYRRARRQLREELGVEPGPELRSLAAAVLRHEVVVPTPRPVSAPAAAPTGGPVSGERRTATFVAFSVGRLARSEAASDPEDLAELHRTLADRVRDVVARHGGSVDGGSEHGLVASFGHPLASEDDTVRAARAALDAVGPSASPAAADGSGVDGSGVGAGVGLDTGVALFRAGRPATGRARARALALAEAAEDGEVLLSTVTASLLGPDFRLAPADRAVAGLDEAPVRLVGEAAAGARLPSAGVLVGREPELAAVAQALLEPAPAVVLLHGEPGAGRTSLLSAVVDRLDHAGAAVVLVRGDRHRRDRALHPLLRAVAARYAEADELTEELVRSGLGSDAATALADRLAAAAHLPGAATAGTPVPPAGTGATRAALLGWWQALARAGTLHVVVDDLHDVDAETLAVLEELPDEVVPRSIVLTSRTRAVPPGLARRVRLVAVNRVDDAAAAALVQAAAAPVRLRNATVRRLVEAGAGHPWHLSELAAAAAREGAPDRGGLVEQVPQGVPVSLQASLLARLDALGPARGLVQCLAACRGEFDADLAAVVAADPEREATDEQQAVLRAAMPAELDRLVTAGVLRSTTRHGVVHHRFAHALLEDLAYTSLPRSVRESLHRRVADWLATSGGEDPDSMAQHLQLSGRPLEAAGRWVQASLRSRADGDFAVASHQARRALQLLDGADLPAVADEVTLIAALLFATSSKMVLGYHPDIDAALRRATTLAVRLGRLDLQVQVHPAMISTLQAAGRYAEARTYGEASLAELQRVGDPRLTGTVPQFHWATLVWMGRLQEADRLFDPQLLLGPQPPVPEAMRGLQAVVRCAGLSLGGLADLTRDRQDSSQRLLAAALQAAQQAGSPDAQSLSHVILAVSHQLRGDAGQTRHHAERVAELALAVGNDWWFVQAQGLLGWALAAQGNPVEGSALLQEAMDHVGGIRQHRPHLMSMLADAHRRAGRLSQARDLLDEAVALADELEEGFYLPHVHLVRAEVLDDAGQQADAVAARSAASSVARRQGQDWFAGRARRRQDVAV